MIEACKRKTTLSEKKKKEQVPDNLARRLRFSEKKKRYHHNAIYLYRNLLNGRKQAQTIKKLLPLSTQ